MKTAGAIAAGREPYYVELGSSIRKVIKYMADKNIGAVSVVNSQDKREVVGIFSERDLMKRVVLKGLSLDDTIIDDIMTKEICVAAVDQSYDSCLDTMKRMGCRHLPVVDNRKLLGMISMRDLFEVNIDEKTQEVKLMNAYIHDLPSSHI